MEEEGGAAVEANGNLPGYLRDSGASSHILAQPPDDLHGRLCG